MNGNLHYFEMLWAFCQWERCFPGAAAKKGAAERYHFMPRRFPDPGFRLVILADGGSLDLLDLP